MNMVCKNCKDSIQHCCILPYCGSYIHCADLRVYCEPISINTMFIAEPMEKLK